MHPSAKLVGLSVLLWACASNPPAEPLRPRSARSVFYCALSMIEADGYSLESEQHQPGDPDVRSAIFRRGVAGSLYLAVWVTTRGELTLRIRTRPLRDPATEEAWRLRIIESCTQ
jgi:hypothetical protein